MDSKSSEKRFALIIDADNVSAKYIKPITDELSKYGTITYKRIYGDWTSTLHAKWKDSLLENSITPIQQFSYTTGKNATDSAMIIDAMDIMYTGSVEGFCIVSSDSDFTRLASRIRESGLTVIGMGEKKTPNPFIVACDKFIYIEVIRAEAKAALATGDRRLRMLDRAVGRASSRSSVLWPISLRIIRTTVRLQVSERSAVVFSSVIPISMCAAMALISSRSCSANSPASRSPRTATA